MNDRTTIAFGFARDLLRGDLAQRMVPDGIDLAKQATELADALLKYLDDSPGPAVEVASASPTSKAPLPVPGEVSTALWIVALDPRAAVHLVQLAPGRPDVLCEQAVCGEPVPGSGAVLKTYFPPGRYCKDCLNSEHPVAKLLRGQIEALR